MGYIYIKEYNSISDASKYTDISRSLIQRCCDGKYKKQKNIYGNIYN